MTDKMKTKQPKQPTTYYFYITMRAGPVLKWTGMTKQKAASMYRWSLTHFDNEARQYEWGIEGDEK